MYNNNYISSYLRYKIFYSANQNIQNEYGNTPLHLAVLKGNIEKAKILLSNPTTDPNKQNSSGKTPLYLAVREDNIEMVQILLSNSKTDLNKQNKYGYAPLHLAIDENKIKIAKILISNPKTDLNKQNKNGDTPLHRAILENNIEMVQIVVNDPRTQLNKQDGLGRTPLHVAAQEGKTEGLQMLLTNANTDPNIKNNYGNTPLHLVLNTNQIEMAKILIYDARTDPNIQDQYGDTPLHVAVLKGSTEVLQILLSNFTTNLNIQNKMGYTPLHGAIYSGKKKTIFMLLKHSKLKIDENIYTETRNSKVFQSACRHEIDISTLELLFRKLKININYCSDDQLSNSLLHGACNTNNIDLVDFLLTQKANSNIKNGNGDTPILIAAKKDINIVNRLILGGANISDTNYHKETVLYIAHSHNIIQNIDQLNYCQYDHSKKTTFFTNELHQISTITNNDKSTYNKVNDFISWCLENDATINLRNTNKLRPVEVAESLYNNALKHSIDEDITHKEKIYHIFLQHTPYYSDSELYYRCTRNDLPNDIFKIIMGYYKALTIDREIAFKLINNPNYCYYENKNIEKKKSRNDLLKQICEKSGYYNPYKALPIM